MASVAPGVPMARTKSIPPELIAGRYRIFDKLGEGAMGAVYRGEQISLKRAVAVKLLKSSLSTDKTLKPASRAKRVSLPLPAPMSSIRGGSFVSRRCAFKLLKVLTASGNRMFGRPTGSSWK